MKYWANLGHPGLIIIGSLALASCGGGGSGATEDTTIPPSSVSAISAVGQITSFGSVYVNGVEYDTTGASYDVDDAAASSDSSLSVGMVVKVQGSVNADNRTGSANSISYDDEIEGIVENLMTDAADPSIKTFTIMGVAVQADQNSTNFDGEDDPGFGFDTIMDGDNVEVSGEYSGDVLIASYIEKQDAADDDYEAKGTVTEYDDVDSFVLVLRNGSTLNVTVAAGAEIPAAGIANDQYVEVEGSIPDPVNFPDSILATKVELEDEDGLEDEDDEVEIKGILNYDVEADSWSVRDVTVAFSENTEYNPEGLQDGIADKSASGLTVEVEGQYLEDILQVDEIELEEDELEFKGDAMVLSSTGPRDGTIQLSFGAATGTVDIIVTADTMFLDDEATDNFDLNSIMDSPKVEIEARWGDDGTSIYASSLHLEDDAGYEIEGPLRAIDEASLTVLDVTFGINAETFFANGTPIIDDVVEVEDIDADGIADSVEIED